MLYMLRTHVPKFYWRHPLILLIIFERDVKKKNEEIWLTPETKSSILQKWKSKDNTKTPLKLWLHNDCGPTYDGKFVYVCISKYSLINITFNNISVILVTVYRCTGGLKKLDLRSGSPRYNYFVGFVNVPFQAPTRDHPFMVIPRNHPLSVAFFDSHGDTEDLLHLRTPGLHRESVWVIAIHPVWLNRLRDLTATAVESIEHAMLLFTIQTRIHFKMW